MTVLRIVVRPADRRGRFSAETEAGEMLVASAREPFLDAARVLVARGVDPATPVTMRRAGAAHDSFVPGPLGRVAKLTVEEGDRSAHFRQWRPRGLDAPGERGRPIAEGPSRVLGYHGSPAGELAVSEGTGARVRASSA